MLFMPEKETETETQRETEGDKSKVESKRSVLMVFYGVGGCWWFGVISF